MSWLTLGLSCLISLAAGDDPPHLSERFCLVHGDPEFLVALGSAWNRYDFSWNGIERTQGHFDFRDLPEQVDASLRRGVNILPILDYEPAWKPGVSPADEETLRLWERYVEKTVAKFKGKLHYWQAWNEPNIDFWKPAPNPRDYAELLRRTYLAAKRADPDVKIVGVNCSNIDLEFTEQVFRYGGLNYCDVLAYQPYRIAPEVGHFEEVRALRELVARFGTPRPIWFTEMGWNSDHFPFADATDLLAERPSRRQAAFLVRYMAIIQAAGIDKVFWFAQSAGGHGLEDRKRGKKRLSFFAYRNLIATLDACRDARELIPRGSHGLYAYLFACPRQSVVLAWSVNGRRRLTLPGMDQAREVRDMLGNTIARPKHPDTVDGEPIYFLFDELPDDLKTLASLRVTPSRIWLQPGASETLTFHWNPVDGVSNRRRITATASPGVHVVPNNASFEKSAETDFTLSVAAGARPRRGVVSVRSGHATWNVEVNIAPRTLWTYRGQSKGYLSPTILRGPDGRTAILVAAYDTPELLCLSAKGARVWQYTAGAPICCSVAVGNIRGDARPEIVAAMPGRQTVFALDAKGVLLWRRTLPGEPPTHKPAWRWTRPEVADIDDDGHGEIVYGDAHGNVTAISQTGNVIWHTKVSDRRCDRPVHVGDIRGDGRDEILVGDAGGNVSCVSRTGAIIWQTDVGADVTAAPIAGALESSNGVAILVGTAGERLLRLAPDGNILWTTDVGGTMDLGTGIVLTDLNGDARNEVVVSTRNHEVIALDADGRILWRAETGAQLRSTPVVGDVDGDGENEILIGSADWLLYAIDPRGRVKWTVNVGNRVDGSPRLVDLDHDGTLDIVLPVRGGKILAMSAAPVRE